MKTLYRTAFALKDTPSPKQDIHSAAKICMDWIFAPGGRTRKQLTRPAGLRDRCENFTGQLGAGWHLETRYLKQNERRYWGMRVTHPDNTDPGIEWRVELTLCSDEEACQFTCLTAVVRTDNSTEPIRRYPSQPRVVQELVKRYGAVDPHTKKELSTKPYLAKAVELPALREFLINPERRQSVVLVSRTKEGAPLVDVSLWAEKLSPLAYVMLAEDFKYTYALEDELDSHNLICWGGSIRIYRPGFTLGSSPYDHPLLVPDSIAKSLERQGEVGLADNILAQIAEYSVSRGYPGAIFWYDLLQLTNAATFSDMQRESASDAELAKLYASDLAAREKLLKEAETELREARAEIDRLSEWRKVAMRAFSEIRSGRNAMDAIRSIPEVESVNDAIAQASSEFPARLLFKLNAKSNADSPYGQPTEVLHALRWIATTYHDAKTGRKPCKDIPASLRAVLPRWEYSGDQSETTMGMFAEWYRMDHVYKNGVRAFATTHIGAGRSRRPEETIRIGFDWDPDLKVAVIGYIGQHQRNRLS
jgi:hypothetical protein